ncbi:MAG: nucleotidyltransferase domain-containing protein [Desulfobia sp.]
MATTALKMKPEDWKRYKPGKEIARQQTQDINLIERKNQALETAKQAASILKQQFKAQKVVMFGSLATEKEFSAWSDIDLVAWGIQPYDFYKAVAMVTGLSPHFKVDLVDPETCRKTILEAIETEGVEI